MLHEPSGASRRCDAPLDEMTAAFERGGRVVEAALTALTGLTADVEALRSRLAPTSAAISVADAERTVLSLAARLEAASTQGENLLVLPRGRTVMQPLVVFALARQATGAVSVQTVEIDRAATALSDGMRRESELAYDRLYRAARGGQLIQIRQATEALWQQITLAASRLSIAKARFDLQASFLRSFSKEPAARLESPLDATGARDMAMEARRLLDRAALHIVRDGGATMRGLTKS